MRVAIAKNGDQVAGHFGHCEAYELFDVREGMVGNFETIKNPGHRPGFLPKLLVGHGIKVMIVDGIGKHAVSIFEQEGVAVYTGVTGKIMDVVNQFAKGEIEKVTKACEGHDHHQDLVKL